ncbi:MAG: hypothetical protein K2K97_01495 [Muribaculaceae bacterium]|nr:hypothetical protein [Muribaculaceae bacterium]
MTQEEALDNLVIATGLSPHYVKSAFESLIAAKLSADEMVAKIKILSKGMTGPKRHVSPYAKFDKFHHKKKRR